MVIAALILGTLAIVCGVLRATESPALPRGSAKRLRWRSLLAEGITAIVVISLIAFPSGDYSAKGMLVEIGISLLVILHFIVFQIFVGKFIRRMKHEVAPTFPGTLFFGNGRRQRSN